jgi:hypothetical protein
VLTTAAAAVGQRDRRSRSRPRAAAVTVKPSGSNNNSINNNNNIISSGLQDKQVKSRSNSRAAARRIVNTMSPPHLESPVDDEIDTFAMLTSGSFSPTSTASASNSPNTLRQSQRGVHPLAYTHAPVTTNLMNHPEYTANTNSNNSNNSQQLRSHSGSPTHQSRITVVVKEYHSVIDHYNHN